MVLMRPHEGDYLWFSHEHKDDLGSGGELQIYLDAKTHPEAKASFSKFRLGVGGKLPMHRHDKTEEIAYFLAGEGIVTMINAAGDEREVPVGPGYVWYNPPGAWHALRNVGSTPLSLVFATIPNEKKGLLSFFRRIGVKPGEEPTRLPPDEFARIAAEHDLILRGSDED